MTENRVESANGSPSPGPSDAFLEFVPRDFARMHLILSAGHDGDDELLLVSDRTDPAAIHNVGVRLGRTPRTTTENAEVIAARIDAAYAGGAHERANGHAAGPDTEIDVEALLAEADKDLLSTQGKAPVVKLVDALLFEALTRRASDIHVQPLDDRTLVRYRLDGVLHTVRTLPKHVTAAVVSRIKVMGRMDIAERRVPQDGRATVTVGAPQAAESQPSGGGGGGESSGGGGGGGRAVDLRISTLPTSYGERAVLRLLDNSQQLCDFDSLGMPDEIAQRFLDRAERSNGIILVTGPTGSGKTTTLYSTLRRIGSPGVNIMTIEDPIEYELSTVGLTISQAQVNTRKGITFATGLRHVLRQDPDIVMVGEIRDAETARIAIQSSLTGHLVLSTLHTNDAPSAVTRLVDLGVEPYLVSSSLSAVLAQRLVRRVHTDCDGDGCPGCLGTGYRGRIGIFELMTIGDEIRELIASRASLGAIRVQARAAGLRTLRDEADRLVERGMTTRSEAARVVEGAA